MKTIKLPQAVLFLAVIIAVTSCQPDIDNSLLGSGIESDPFQLVEGKWVNGSLSSLNAENWFSLNVTSGTTYYIWWNDTREGDGSKTADIFVAYYREDTLMGTDSGWNTPLSFTATTSGTILLKVMPYNDSPGGSYGIVYSTRSTMP